MTIQYEPIKGFNQHNFDHDLGTLSFSLIDLYEEETIARAIMPSMNSRISRECNLFHLELRNLFYRNVTE